MSRMQSRMYLTCFALALLVAAPGVIRDAASIGYAALWRVALEPRVPPSARIQSEAFRSLVVESGGGSCTRLPYAAKVNAGLALLEPHVEPRSRILVMDFANPFSLALSQPSPRGDAPWWQMGTSFSARTYLPAAEVFREVTLVMYPKCPEDDATAATMMSVYRGYLGQHFAPRGENGAWVLYARR